MKHPCTEAEAALWLLRWQGFNISREVFTAAGGWGAKNKNTGATYYAKTLRCLVHALVYAIHEKEKR